MLKISVWYVSMSNTNALTFKYYTF